MDETVWSCRPARNRDCGGVEWGMLNGDIDSLNGECCLLNHGVKRRVEWASVVGDKIHKKRMVNGDLGGRREEEGRRELTGTPHDESPSRAAEREIGSNLFLNDFGG
jgi:hypothetical protein